MPYNEGMPTTTFTVRGHKVRSASQRRYIVVIVQPRDREAFVQERRNGEWVTEPITVPAGARVHKRSNSVATAHQHASRYGFPTGGNFAVVIDTVTGEEV